MYRHLQVVAASSCVIYWVIAESYLDIIVPCIAIDVRVVHRTRVVSHGRFAGIIPPVDQIAETTESNQQCVNSNVSPTPLVPAPMNSPYRHITILGEGSQWIFIINQGVHTN